MVDVFISYPRTERSRVEQVKSKLEELNLDLFFDIDGIDGGAEFPAVITRALDSSKAVLACCSPSYFTRPWCLSEAHEAATRGILVPVVMERFDRTAPPVNLRSLNFLDLSSWSGEDDHEDWGRALHAISKLIGRKLSAPSSSGPGSSRPNRTFAAQSNESAARADVLGDLRETWKNFPARNDQTAVAAFLKRVSVAAGGTGLEFEVEHLLQSLIAGKLPAPRFEMTVEDSFSISGRGTVVTGVVRGRDIETGLEVEISTKSGKIRSKVTGVEYGRKLRDKAEVGKSVGLLLRDVERASVRSGDLVREVD